MPTEAERGKKTVADEPGRSSKRKEAKVNTKDFRSFSGGVCALSSLSS